MPDQPAPPNSERGGLAQASRTSLISMLPAGGATIKHYEIIRVLGRGGMGVVYLARDTRLGRLVALKLLYADDAAPASRMLAEARATAMCKHENIVVVYDVDEHEGAPYLVLEYIEGQTLRAYLDQRSAAAGTAESPNTIEAISTGVCLDLMLPVVRALACAHAHGIVHRDLKPENILLAENGPVKVVDFGIAQRMEADTRSSTADAPSNDDESMSGTLAYMAPEFWLGLPVDHAVDIWALGIILYELVTGAHPLAPTTPARLAAVGNLETPMPKAREARPDMEPLAAIIDHCLEKRQEQRIGSAAQLLTELLSLRAGASTPLRVDAENPFAGLLAFQEADEARFFGRERDVAGALARLRFQPLVAIAGPSGAGKSSFVRAGVIPGWKRLGEQNMVFVVRPGQRPLAALAAVIFDAALSLPEDNRAPLPDNIRDVGAIADKLRVEFGFLGASLRAHCRAAGRRSRILLFVDQFEEAHTLTADPAERAAFLACLAGAADDASSPLRVILAMRSDFLDRAADDPKLMIDVVRGLVFLGPMSAEDLRFALTKPVEAFGYRFESDDLIGEILDALGRTASPLPLLQFTAAKLWEARDRERHLLTKASYDALGGVEGTLASHADAVLAAMSARDQPLVRTFFERLVTPERTRAVVPVKELCELAADPADGERVLGRLVEARLLVIETEAGREGPSAEIVHESLIARWPKLSLWLSENEDEGVFLSRLRSAARQWRDSGRPRGLLWRDEAMHDALRWRERSRARLSPAEAEFLDAVFALSRATRRARRVFIFILVATSIAIAVAMTYLAVLEREASEEARERATQTRQLATQARKEAARARDAARLASARDLADDPTSALALLREVEAPGEVLAWAPLATKAIRAPIARAVLHGHDGMVWTAEFSPDGERVATSSADIASIWPASGAAPPIVLRGHTGPVWRAAWSPDGGRVLTASWDGTARVFQADGKGEPVVLKHPERVSWADFSPDGRLVATTSWDKAVRIFRADGTGEPIVLRGHGERARRVRFSPDGKRVATASYDKTARVFRVDGSEKPIVLAGHEDGVIELAWSADGRRIATASLDKTVRIHVIDGSAKPIVLRGHSARINDVAMSPDGRLVVSASSDGTARVWKADGTGEPIVLAVGLDVRFALFSPDGKYVLTGSGDKTARLWPVGELDTMITIQGHDGPVEWGSFSKDGKRFVTAAGDGTARIWDTQQPSAPVVFRDKAPQHSHPRLRLDHRGGRILWLWRGTSVVHVGNTDGTGHIVLQGGPSMAIREAAWSPDDRRIAVGGEDGSVRVIQLGAAGDPLVLRAPDGAVDLVDFSPDGSRLAVAHSNGKVRIHHADGSGEPVVLDAGSAGFFRLQWSKGGARLLTVSIDERVARIFRAEDFGASPVVLEGHTNILHWAEFDPDGKRVVTTSADNTARIWSVDGAVPPLVLHGHSHEIRHAKWSPDGARVATASDDDAVRVFRADGTGAPVVLRGPIEAPMRVGWSPDGRRIVAAFEKTLQIWNADGSGVPLILEGHSPLIHDVVWTPDGDHVASSATDGTIRIWPNVSEVPSLAGLEEALWRASAFCLPSELRRDRLGVSDDVAQKDVESCRQRVAAAAKPRALP